MLEASGLQVKIGERTILRDVSFSAEKGECIGLIGPNGSGKSTLIRTLCGLIPAAQGAVTANGKNIASFRSNQLAKYIGYVPQDTTIDFDFLVKDMVLMGRHAHIPRFGTESAGDYQAAQQAMERTGIEHLADRPVTRLSGGQRQMVFIAKVLAQQPSIYLFDEPVSALDINRQLQVLELIRSLSDEGALTITAIHDLNLAARYCDRLFLMQDGQIIAAGTPEEVLTSSTVQAAYGVLSVVRRDPVINAEAVTALSRVSESAKKEDEDKPRKHIHVIAGAGAGSELLTALYQLPVHVTVGPLEEHDPDAVLAKQLGMHVLTYPSFEALSEHAAAAAKPFIDQADLIIAAPVPIGSANERLAELVQSATIMAAGSIETSQRTLADYVQRPAASLDQLKQMIEEEKTPELSLR